MLHIYSRVYGTEFCMRKPANNRLPPNAVLKFRHTS